MVHGGKLEGWNLQQCKPGLASPSKKIVLQTKPRWHAEDWELENGKGWVYLESPWGGLESGFHFLFPEVDHCSLEDPRTEANLVSHSAAAGQLVTPPLPADAFEVATGN